MIDNVRWMTEDRRYIMIPTNGGNCKEIYQRTRLPLTSTWMNGPWEPFAG